MKAKITRGAGFKGLLSYALGKPDSEIIGGTLSGESVSEYAQEFGIIRRLRPEVMKPVWHASLSLPPGERATSEDWKQLSHLFLSRMEFDPDAMQWLAVRHSDRDHDHIHIIVNRVRNDGSLWLGRRDVFRAIEATQELEVEFDLQKTPGFQKKSSFSPTSNERRMMSRAGERSAKSTVAAKLSQILKSGALSRIAFEEACKNAGIEPRANLSKNGKMSGYSFSLDGHAFPGSKVGWGWKKLSNALGESEKSHSEVARDLRSAIFATLESGKFASEMSKKGWSINENQLFSPCGQTINLEEWGILPQEIDAAAAKIKNAPAGERAPCSGGILPPDLESLAILAVGAPGVLAALVALDLLIRIGKIADENRREARREAWKKVHEIAAHIEEEKKNGRDDESPYGNRRESEKTLRGRGAEIEGADRADRDHGGASAGAVPDMGGKSLRSLRADRTERGERAVSPVERPRCASTLISDDRGAEKNGRPEAIKGKVKDLSDLDPDRLTDLRHLAAHLASLADAPIAPPAPEAPTEEPDPLPEEPEIDVEEPEEIEEEESWQWGR